MGKYYLASRSLQKKPEIIPILNAPSLKDVEDAEKLRDGRQLKFHIYGDVYILSERIDSYEQEEHHEEQSEKHPADRAD